MRSLTDIRRHFVDYFVRNDHTHVPSSSLIPRNDPTLLFTSAGMVQFKDVFTGLEKRDYKRAVSSQKCLRAGGKHNDLENVGYTARHHTFFEMLGNFSFGDYFKDDAISLAWNLVTKEFGLDANRLLVTVYSEDEEAAKIWKKITGFSDEKIIRIPTSDNFWSMGDTGPCGPCTEIFFDHGDDIWGGPPGSADQDGDRFIEIWNLVFMQFDQQSDGTKINLPKPSVDTGMGLERIAAVLQGKHNNYETDLFKTIIETSAELSGQAVDGPFQASHRVIADHLRASSFLIADGVLPSNEGRGYVLRRIMRRAMRHVHLLGVKDVMMWRLVPTLVHLMGEAYPELHNAQSLISETMRLEEERFQTMLERGMRLLEQESEKLSSNGKLAGDVAFKLYDTFGFPLDLTQDVLRSKKMTVDVDGFQAAMEKQRAESRANWSGSGEAKTESTWYDIKESFGATEFLGYTSNSADGKIVALVKDGVRVDCLSENDEGFVVCNQTPFYGESGGQMGDSGVISCATNDTIAHVNDTVKKLGELIVHRVVVKKGTLKVDDVVHLNIDVEKRSCLRAHHSATHLLHAALRNALGTSVTQKGSLVAHDRLRFDFSYNQAIEQNILQEIEDVVNKQIRENANVSTKLMAMDKAVESGAMALFGEKYADEVRVVSMGSDDAHFSTELCGGTHVKRTGDIGLFKIISETGISSGVRRIEAFVGLAAQNYIKNKEKLFDDVLKALKASPVDVVGKVQTLLDEKKKNEREIQTLRQELATGGAKNKDVARTIGDVAFVFQKVENIPAKDLRGIADQLKANHDNAIVAVASVVDEKVALVVCLSEKLTSRFSASDFVKAASTLLGGSGGGRAEFAQGGGSDLGKIDDLDPLFVTMIEKK